MLGTLPAAAQRGLPGLLAVELAAGPADGFLIRDNRGGAPYLVRRGPEPLEPGALALELRGRMAAKGL